MKYSCPLSGRNNVQKSTVLTPVFQAQYSITIYISIWQKFSKILNPQLKHGNPKSGAEEALFSSDDRGPFATLVPTLTVLYFAVS